ncbi:MAG: transcriptional regulator/antitoxin, MazE [Deltaproteobacteria bacterium]|nr:MAG: transcriptional regulator/antitoxin, MazE [Deltaproteobacteria bacterium]RLB06269.1 MAG: transcriptional regulator/antitoxin, MazE [Deltaproteobacteria bacterium]
MLTKIQKWGNSQGVRIAKNILADAGLNVGDQVEISVKGGSITISPAKRKRGRHNLEELVAGIPETYEASEVDWGEPVGKEIW